VLKLLHQTGSLCVVASHDVELTEILNGIYDNYHFSEKIIESEIEFDYLLKDGPSRTTNAIKLLEYMGFDKRIVDEANELSNPH
jgi:DNA mismatch repair ATPase MutS